MTTINFRANTPEYYQEQKLQQQNNSTYYATTNQNQNAQDSVELANAQQAPIKEKSAIAETIENITGIDITNPKKALKIVALSIATVVGVMFLGNKIAHPSQKLGDMIDNVLLDKNNILGKAYTGISELFSKGAKKAKKILLKPQFMQDISTALKNPKAQRWSLFKGYGNGAKGIFAQTVVDTIKNALEKDADGTKRALQSLLGADNVTKILGDLNDPKITNVAFADNFLDLVKKASDKDGKGLQKFFETIDAQSALSNVKMKDWRFVNGLNKIAKNITGKEIRMLNGNLGDSLMKYSAIRGQSAKTLPARIIQLLPTLMTEQYSSFVNDKSDFGIMLVVTSVCPTIAKMLDMPAEQRARTEAHDLLSSSLSFLASMPIAFGTVYGAAALKDVSKNPLLKTIGKVFSFGLDGRKTSLGGVAGVVGGIGRLLAIVTFSGLASKPISKLCDKIFGKPYDKSEELKKQAQQQQMEQIIPELGISQKELMEKIQKNPQALEKIQNDPEAIKKLQQNPKLLLDVLDGKDINSLNTSTSQSNPTMSPSLTSRLNNSGQNFATEKMDKKEQTQTSSIPTTSNYDTATYIPSSEYIAKNAEYDDATISKMNSVLAASDRALEQFEKVRSL